jgi:hypothetical protein
VAIFFEVKAIGAGAFFFGQNRSQFRDAGGGLVQGDSPDVDFIWGEVGENLLRARRH